MIYIAEINVDAHERWGEVFSGEFILPPKIYRLKSVAATVVPDLNTLVVVKDKSGDSTLHRIKFVQDELEYYNRPPAQKDNYCYDDDGNDRGWGGNEDKDNISGTVATHDRIYPTLYKTSVVHSYQTGTINAAINDYGEIGNLPTYVVSQLHNSCWNRNKRTFNAKTLIRQGSLLRLTYQERIASPFVYDEILGGYPAYKVKFYIEYASK